MGKEKELIDQDIGDEGKRGLTGKENVVLHTEEGDKPNVVIRKLLEDGKLISETVSSGKKRKKN